MLTDSLARDQKLMTTPSDSPAQLLNKMVYIILAEHHLVIVRMLACWLAFSYVASQTLMSSYCILTNDEYSWLGGHSHCNPFNALSMCTEFGLDVTDMRINHNRFVSFVKYSIFSVRCSSATFMKHHLHVLLFFSFTFCHHPPSSHTWATTKGNTILKHASIRH